MPIEVALPQDALDKTFVVFDGRVVEIFRMADTGRGRRFHVGTLSAIQVDTDKKGLHTLVIKATPFYTERLSVVPAALDRAQQLVAEVQQAIMENR